MVIRKRVKGLFVLLMAAVLFLNSIPASAAELGFGRATAGDFISEEIDEEIEDIGNEDIAEPQVFKPGDHE